MSIFGSDIAQKTSSKRSSFYTTVPIVIKSDIFALFEQCREDLGAKMSIFLQKLLSEAILWVILGPKFWVQKRVRGRK